MNGTSDRIAIRVWGGLRVVDARGAPIEVASRKARACLALLARSDAGRLSRERLAGMLWGDRSDEQARANLRQLLYELKPLSQGGVLGFDRQAVWLAPDRDDETAVMARTASAQLAAMLPERGLVPLADLDGIGDEFDDWLAAERAAIETELRRFVQQRIEDALAAGDAAGARALSDAWMRHDACDETMARLGLRADAALGDRAGMQQRQRRLELALAAELGVKPAATTSTLARDLDGALTQAIADPASRDRAGPMSRTGDVDVAPARSSPRMARVAVVAIVLSLVFGYAAWRAMAHAPTAARQEAVALAARAHALTHGRTTAGYSQAAALAQRAITLDPDYAPGWAELAAATLLRGWTGLPVPAEAAWGGSRVDAERYVERALSLDPHSARALAVRGLMLGNSAAAGLALRDAASAADDAETFVWLGNWLVVSGSEREAMDAYRRAAEIDPLWDRGVRAYVNYSESMGEHEAADRAIERFAATSPNPYMVASLRMEHALSRGDLVDAAVQVRKALEHAPDNPWIEMLGVVGIAMAVGDTETIERLSARYARLHEGVAPLLDTAQAVVARVEPAPVAWLDHCMYCVIDARRLLSAGRPDLLVAAIERHDGDPFEIALVFGGGQTALAALRVVGLRAVHRDADADQALAAIRARIGRRRTQEFSTDMENAVALALAGRDEEAVRELDRAIDKGWRGQSSFWAVDPADEPAFAALRERADFARVRARLADERGRVREQVSTILAGIPAPIVSARTFADDL